MVADAYEKVTLVQPDLSSSHLLKQTFKAEAVDVFSTVDVLSSAPPVHLLLNPPDDLSLLLTIFQITVGEVGKVVRVAGEYMAKVAPGDSFGSHFTLKWLQ